jgi:hypothetical protein
MVVAFSGVKPDDPQIPLQFSHVTPRKKALWLVQKESEEEESTIQRICVALGFDSETFEALFLHRDTAQNGLTLTTRLHQAWERGALYVDHKTLKVVARATAYQQYSGIQIITRENFISPNPKFFAIHEQLTAKVLKDGMVYCPKCWLQRREVDVEAHTQRDSCYGQESQD